MSWRHERRKRASGPHFSRSVPPMNNPIQDVCPVSRSSGHRNTLTFVLLIAIGLGSSTAGADPADFQAMPGLWKTVVSVFKHGSSGEPSIQWHCVNEDADPWLAFANFSVPGTQCTRSDEYRSSTALAWTIRCYGHPPISGRGRVDFDSSEHYTASIMLHDRGEVMQVEGKRRGACTSPSD
jgi:hypothetical protein